VNFDPDIMASLPFFLRFLDPFVEFNKNSMLALQACTGMPWYSLII